MTGRGLKAKRWESSKCLKDSKATWRRTKKLLENVREEKDAKIAKWGRKFWKQIRNYVRLLDMDNGKFVVNVKKKLVLFRMMAHRSSKRG